MVEGSYSVDEAGEDRRRGGSHITQINWFYH